MNTKDFLRSGVRLGEATRRATDFVSQFILSGGDKTKLDASESNHKKHSDRKDAGFFEFSAFLVVNLHHRRFTIGGGGEILPASLTRSPVIQQKRVD